jgi:hypothetical protein
MGCRTWLRLAVRITRSLSWGLRQNGFAFTGSTHLPNAFPCSCLFACAICQKQTELADCVNSMLSPVKTKNDMLGH